MKWVLTAPLLNRLGRGCAGHVTLFQTGLGNVFSITSPTALDSDSPEPAGQFRTIAAYKMQP